MYGVVFVVEFATFVMSFFINLFPLLPITVIHGPSFFFYLFFSNTFYKNTGLAILLE